MATIVGLPKLSPTMEEGTLARWAKKEGDAVEIDDLIAEVETDKATMEWRSFDKGVILKILVEEGAILEPDAPVMIFGQEGEEIGALLASIADGGGGPKVEEEPRGGASIQPVGEPVSVTAIVGDLDPKEEAQEEAADPAASRGHDGRVLASPLVRRLAREEGVDLTELGGTGPHGRIIKRDLEAYLERRGSEPASAAPSAPVQTGAGYERRPPEVKKLSSMRRTIARRLTESKQNVPHFYLTIDTDAEALIEARAAINAELKKEGEKISFNDLVIKACAVALRRVPEVNASFMGKEIHLHQVVDISVAVAVPDGLVTPVVRDADIKGVAAIGREVRELAARARDKKLAPEEMMNGTFSISNLGMYGIEDFAAVINPPEGALLAVGGIRDEPVVKDGAVVPGKRMRVTLSCDHRVIDGALGARWLQVLKALLEKPALMLI